MRFIFEGVDLMGKTTLIKAVNSELIRRGFHSHYRHSIKSTDVGTKLYECTGKDAYTNSLIIAACKRYELEVQRELVERGGTEQIFLMDRWWLSAVVYGGLDIRETVRMVYHEDYVRTDLLFYIKFDQDLFKSRLADIGGQNADHLEPDLDKAIHLCGTYEHNLSFVDNLVTVWPNDSLEQKTQMVANRIMEEVVNAKRRA